VAARDLEAELRAALEAQRGLQARKKRREKLLLALGEVGDSHLISLAVQYKTFHPAWY